MTMQCSNLMTGSMVLEPAVLNLIEGDGSTWEEGVLPQLAAADRLSDYRHPGFWQPIDTLPDRTRLGEMRASCRAFLETLIELHKINDSLALASTLLSHVGEKGKLVREFSTVCDAIEAVASRAVERLQVLTRAKFVGAVYDIVSRAHYQAYRVRSIY